MISAYNKRYIDAVLAAFVATLYEHSSIIKHATDKTKMRPGPKIEHHQMLTMFCKIL